MGHRNRTRPPCLVTVCACLTLQYLRRKRQRADMCFYALFVTQSSGSIWMMSGCAPHRRRKRHGEKINDSGRYLVEMSRRDMLNVFEKRFLFGRFSICHNPIYVLTNLKIIYRIGRSPGRCPRSRRRAFFAATASIFGRGPIVTGTLGARQSARMVCCHYYPRLRRSSSSPHQTIIFARSSQCSPRA